MKLNFLPLLFLILFCSWHAANCLQSGLFVKAPRAGPALLTSRPNCKSAVKPLQLGASAIPKSLSAVAPTLLRINWRALSQTLRPADMLSILLVHFTHKKILQTAHKVQSWLWEALALGKPYEYPKSILGFLEARTSLLIRLMVCNYFARLLCLLLVMLGARTRPDFPVLLSSISYMLYMAHFLDMFKKQFLGTFLPHISESRRQSYVVNRSTSVVIWIFACLLTCEMVSTFLKVPLSSTLAFGGVGGLAVGLSARDIAANFLGGMLLLFNEPFTPGDMVTFKLGGSEVLGRVERVGWGQTRIRGKDTRPTYVPNSHFVQTAITNMERITHRKFETSVRLRMQDSAVVTEVIEQIQRNLRGVSKLDVLSMPFRVSLVRIGEYFLEVEVTAYFATKSIDEFLSLQQAANLEIIKAVHSCGAQLASLVPTQLPTPSAPPPPLLPVESNTSVLPQKAEPHVVL